MGCTFVSLDLSGVGREGAARDDATGGTREMHALLSASAIRLWAMPKSSSLYTAGKNP